MSYDNERYGLLLGLNFNDTCGMEELGQDTRCNRDGHVRVNIIEKSNSVKELMERI